MTTLAADMDATQGYVPNTETEADLPSGFYTLGSEMIRVRTEFAHGRSERGFGQLSVTGRQVDRAIAGTTAAAHSTGVTFTRVNDPGSGGGSGGVTVIGPFTVAWNTTPDDSGAGFRRYFFDTIEQGAILYDVLAFTRTLWDGSDADSVIMDVGYYDVADDTFDFVKRYRNYADGYGPERGQRPRDFWWESMPGATLGSITASSLQVLADPPIAYGFGLGYEGASAYYLGTKFGVEVDWTGADPTAGETVFLALVIPAIAIPASGLDLGGT